MYHGKKKTWYLIQRRLPVRSSALQPWKWQLTGIGYGIAAQANGTHCRATDFGPTVMQPDVLYASQPR